MAQNYLEFSEVIENLTSKELQWWEDQEIRIAKVYDNDAEWGHDYEPDDDMDMCVDFAIQKDRSQVWFHGDDGGNVEKIAHIVQQFLVKFRPNDYFTLTWACWCSKPRLGQFDGGAMFVTAHEAKFHNVSEWLDQRETEWNKNYSITHENEATDNRRWGILNRYTKLYWCIEENRWTDKESATVFKAIDLSNVSLPTGGQWEQYK